MQRRKYGSGSITKKGYVRIKIYGRIYQAHRLVWMYSFGVWPKDQIDHINQIKFDNRICNLRESNSSLNQQNKGLQINNSSGFKGVYWTKSASKWRAIITFNSLDIHLGYFTNLNDAIAARKQAEEQYHTHRVKV